MTMRDVFLKSTKRYLCDCRPYILIKNIKLSVENSLRNFDELKMLTLTPEFSTIGNVLFSYRQAIDAFLIEAGQSVPNIHTNYWASMQMVKTFLDLGYCVDIISHRNNHFLPKKCYSIFVDVRRNLERLAPLLNKDCIKIMHLDTAHILFHNAAESRRLLELQQRRGFTLRPRRFEEPNLGIECADYATTTGNAFTISTFSYAGKPIYRLPVPAAVSCAWPERKDWEGSRRHFFWFNSGGLVHKGLDLVLDAFADMPDYYLTVCGPIEREEDFVRAYHKELYHTPNIKTVGWIDVNGVKFQEITSKCIGVILLSCSEGASASSVNCMHAGLIPILSRECGVDIEDFGFLIRDCSVETIKRIVQTVANLPLTELKDRARQAWEFVRANHTRERFGQEYYRIVTKINDMHGNSAKSIANGTL